MKKIVYCTYEIAIRGGEQRILINKANYLASHGYEVHFLTSDQQNRQPAFPLDKRVQMHDCEVNYTLELKQGSYWAKTRNFFRCLRKHKKAMQSILEELHADVVISTFGHEVYLLPQIKDSSKRIVELHKPMMWCKSFRRGSLGYFDKYVFARMYASLKHYDKFVLLTQEDAQNWKGLYNIKVIPNSCAFQYPVPALLENKKVIGVGRYSYDKGFDRLIKAWSIVNKKTKEWELHLIGEGELQDELQKLINELGLHQTAFLDGFSSNIQNEYPDASIFVLSSTNEGFGLVIIEAEAAGVPVVAFACPCGPRDLITDGENGYLVKDGDIEGLADRIIDLIEHPEKRKEMGGKAFEHAKNFTEENVMKKWMDLFDELLKTK